MVETHKHEPVDNAPSKQPLDPDGGSPGQRSRTHAATTIQSSVTPEDYPAEERAQQEIVSTSGKTKLKK